MILQKIDIPAKSEELKSYISQFETISFVTQICYILNSRLRMGENKMSLESPARQILYLLSLFLSTEKPDNTNIFDLSTGNMKYIESLLAEIEEGYRYNDWDALSLEGRCV